MNIKDTRSFIFELGVTMNIVRPYQFRVFLAIIVIIMAVIKDYNFDQPFGDFDDDAKSVTHLIKSDQLQSNDTVVVPGTVSIEDVTPDSHIDDTDSEIFVEQDQDTQDIVLENIVEPEAPEQPAVDVDKIKHDIKVALQQELKQHVDDVLHAIQGLTEARDTVIESAKDQLIDLSLNIAEKVIKSQIEHDSDIIKTVIEDTFNKIAGSDRVTFKVHPDDIPVLTDYQQYIESRLIGVQKITIQPDNQVDRGGAIIETDLGFVDVTIKEKLNIITQTFNKIKSTL
jgi:flagellar biosynthesis/type III secretory pathway protein FliH